MNSISNHFGLTVAYLLPGFIALAGLAPFVPLIAVWLTAGASAEASLGPPIYALLAATTIGMIVSSFRWLIIDHIHHWTGLTPPTWDDSRLAERISGFRYLVENHYRYYQFVANTLIALLFAYTPNRLSATWAHFGVLTDGAVFLLIVVLFAASRDALSKYYTRTGRLIGEVAEKGSSTMYNGNDNQHESGSSARPPAQPQQPNKPRLSSKPQKGKQKASQQAK